MANNRESTEAFDQQHAGGVENEDVTLAESGSSGSAAEGRRPSPPYVPGQRLKLTITSVAYGGQGVGRVDGFVVFVPFTAAGEEVEAELTEVKKNFARAKLVHVIQRSPDRVEPACRYFTDCGGCQYQHLDYEAQLRLKRQQIGELLQRLGGFAKLQIDPVEACPRPYGYRNRIMVRTQWDRVARRLVLGFIRHDNRLVVDVEQCPIAEPALNEQLMVVRSDPPPKGGLKVMLRMAPEDWELPRDSFFQNNFHALPRLTQTVRSFLGESGARYLIDAYCGVGFFGIECSDLVERFTGVEIDKVAIQAARRNLVRRDVKNGDFVSGAAEEWITALIAKYPADRTALVTDPPRVGCAPSLIEAIRAARLQQVIYVSCHPATLARDLKALCADGVYEVRRVTPIDMFPQTQHLECVVDIRRRGNEGPLDEGG